METEEQKLLDEIYEITEREYIIPEIEDFYHALIEIRKKIKEYRQNGSN